MVPALILMQGGGGNIRVSFFLPRHLDWTKIGTFLIIEGKSSSFFQIKLCLIILQMQMQAVSDEISAFLGPRSCLSQSRLKPCSVFSND